MFGGTLKLGRQAGAMADLDHLLDGYPDEKITATWTVSADDMAPAPYTGTLFHAKQCAMKFRTFGAKGWAKIELDGKLIWAL